MIVLLLLVPTLWILGAPISRLFTWAKTLKKMELFFLETITGLIILSLINYMLFFLDIRRGDYLPIVCATAIVLWIPILFNENPINSMKKMSLPWTDSKEWKQVQDSFYRISVIFSVMIIYIFLASIGMTGAESSVLHQNTDNHFHSILIMLFIKNGHLSSTWSPIWDAPVIYPQGAHGIAGFVGVVICTILNVNYQAIDVVTLTLSFEIVSSALTIGSIYLLSSILLDDERVALLIPFVLVFLGRMFLTTYTLYSWLPGGGISEITVVCILPFIITCFLKAEKDFRSRDLWLSGILFGGGLVIHTHLLFYFLTAVIFYFPTIWVKRRYFDQKTTIITNKEWQEIKKGILMISTGALLIIPYYVWIFLNMPPNKLTNPYPSYRALLRVLNEIMGLPFEITTFFALLASYKILKEKNEQLCIFVGWFVASISLAIGHGIFLWIIDRRIAYFELIQPYRLEQLIFIPRAILASIGLVMAYNYIKQPDFHISFDSKRIPFINQLSSANKRNIITILGIILAINIGVTVGGMTVLLDRPTVPESDVYAYGWLENNTPKDAFILNDDSGFWIPSITGRSIAFPNIAASDRPLVSQAIWDLYSQLRTLNASEGRVAGEIEHQMMIREGLEYIFLTPNASYTAEYWVNIPKDIFIDETYFHQLYNNGTQIYRILPYVVKYS